MGKHTQQGSINSRSIPYLREARQTRLLRTLLVLAIIYTLYLAKSLLIPLLFSALVALLLSPLVAVARKFFIPRAISAAVLMAVFIAPFSFLGVELAEPAERWMKTLPKMAAQVTQEIEELSDSLQSGEVEELSQPEKKRSSFFGWFDDEDIAPEPKEDSDSLVTGKLKQSGMEMLMTALTGAPLLLAQLFGCIILILFLLVFGPELFSVFIKDFPVVTNKRKALVVVNHIQRELSNYIVTVSIINSMLGLVTALAFTFLGVEDALLWGALVALMNFVPYLGGLFSCSILLVAGVVQFGFVSAALLPAATFLAINIAESQFVTPAILGKSLRLNPLVIILWLSIMGWLWGVVGVLLSVPVLMSIKIIFANIGVLPHWVKLIESR